MRLGIVTDVHHAPPHTAPDGFINPHQFASSLDRLQRSLDWLVAQGAKRIAVLGDLTHRGDAASMSDVLKILVGSGLPVWVIPGNHDLGETGTMLADEVARIANDALTVLDTQPQRLGELWSAVGAGVAFPASDGNWFATGFPDMATLRDGPLLILSHFPVLEVAKQVAAANLKYAGDMNNRADIASAFSTRSAPTIVLNGHLHVRYAQAAGHVLQASCGAQVESLFEATLVDLGEWDEHRVSWESVAMDPVWDGPNPAMSEPSQSWRWDDTGWHDETRSQARGVCCPHFSTTCVKSRAGCSSQADAAARCWIESRPPPARRVSDAGVMPGPSSRAIAVQVVPRRARSASSAACRATGSASQIVPASIYSGIGPSRSGRTNVSGATPSHRTIARAGSAANVEAYWTLRIVFSGSPISAATSGHFSRRRRRFESIARYSAGRSNRTGPSVTQCPRRIARRPALRSPPDGN